MKTVFLLASICASASAFGINTPTAMKSSTALSALLPKEDMSADQLKMEDVRETWNSIRLLDYDDIPDDVGDDFKEAHKRYFEKYHYDMHHMKDIAKQLAKMEPKKVQKKTKGQRKRDKWAKVQALAAARAAKK